MLRKIKNDQKQRLCKKISEIKPYYAYERKCNIIVILMRLKYESKSKIVKICSDGHEIFLCTEYGGNFSAQNFKYFFPTTD